MAMQRIESIAGRRATMRRGMMVRRMGAVAALLAAMALLEMPTMCGLRAVGAYEGSDVGGEASTRGRTLSLIGLARSLADAIVSGNIDEAARILVDTVRRGDSESVIQGLFQSRSRPGIAQTIVRAFRLGLGSDELARVVSSGAEDNEEASGVVQEVVFLINENFAPVPQTPEGQYVAAGAVAEPPRQVAYYSPTLSPPAATITTFVDGEAIRECRGKKEKMCCQAFGGVLPSGCLCESGECRFEFINADPVVIVDTRRADRRACSCL